MIVVLIQTWIGNANGRHSIAPFVAVMMYAALRPPNVIKTTRSRNHVKTRALLGAKTFPSSSSEPSLPPPPRPELPFPPLPLPEIIFERFRRDFSVSTV